MVGQSGLQLILLDLLHEYIFSTTRLPEGAVLAADAKVRLFRQLLILNF